MRTRPSLQWSEGAAGPVIAGFADDDAPTRWEDSAACAEVGGDGWFPEVGGSGHVAAKAVCRSCPVVAECLAFALAHMGRRDPLLNFGEWGIWGATSREDRLRLRRGVRPMTAAERALQAIEDGEKACSMCDVVKPLGSYWRYAHASDGHKSACITCLSAAQSRRASRAA
jgi:WhiB family redox-sensing transcriptional regulator